MNTPDGQLATDHYDALADWLDVVRAELGSTPILNIEAAQLPGALFVAVGPDPEGIATSEQLIRWANPAIALLVSPDAESADFDLYLDGDERVAIPCGPSLPPLPRRATSRALPEEDWDRIAERLIDILGVLVATDQACYPNDILHAPSDLVDAYFTDYDGGEDRVTITEIVNSIDVHRAGAHLQKSRVLDHRNDWARRADEIAGELLDGPDGATLGSSGESTRQQIATANLRDGDAVCATMAAALPR